MFTLQTTKGETLLMRNGQPFVYWSRETARAGKRYIEAQRKQVLRIVAA